MTIDKKILDDPLKTFDYLSEKVYSDPHPTSAEFIKRMRKVIEGESNRTMQYTVLVGYLMVLEQDTYITADVNRMKIVCEIEEYIKQRCLLLPSKRAPHHR